MNLILFYPDELDTNRQLVLTDRRAVHVLKVLRPGIGATLKVGAVNGMLGRGTVTTMDRRQLGI